MQKINFPVQFTFKISTFANDFTATDAEGRILAYVRQKMFKFKDNILIYSDESKTKINYQIQADRWLDFSAAYSFLDENEQEFGKIVRKGWRSIWRAHYEILDEHQAQQYRIGEENPWAKVMDSLLSDIPILGMFTGYFFNPAYLVTNTAGEPIIRLKKMPSFWGRQFELVRLGNMDDDDDDRVLLGLMMMILLERRRG